jgi:multisubunit Na+/H+ antiporter MnhB subunit
MADHVPAVLSGRETRLAGVCLTIAGVAGVGAAIISVPLSDPGIAKAGAILLGAGSLVAVVLGTRLAASRHPGSSSLPRPVLLAAGTVLGFVGLVLGILVPSTPLDSWATDAGWECIRLAREGPTLPRPHS